MAARVRIGGAVTSSNALASLTPRVVAGFLGTWVLALMAANLVPVLITSLVSELGLTIGQAGTVATAMSLGSVLAMLGTARFIDRWDRPATARCGLLLIFAGFGAGAAVLHPTVVIAGIVAGGVGSGIVVAAGNAAAASTADPDRTSTVVLVANRFAAAALLAIAPLFQGDLRMLLAMIAAVGLVGVVTAGGLPNLPAGFAGAASATRRNATAGVVLAATMGTWSMTEEMVYSMTGALAKAAHLSPGAGGLLLSASVVGGFFGAMASPLLLRLFGRAWSLAAVVAVSTLAKVLMITVASAAVHGAALIAWGFLYGTVLTLVTGLAARMDVSGRIAVLVSTVYLFGLALGPFAGGNLIEVVSPAGYAAAVTLPSLAFGTALFVIARRNRALDRPAAAGAPSGSPGAERPAPPQPR